MAVKQVCNTLRIVVVALVACTCALGQYGGPGGGTGGTGSGGTYNPSGKSYGHGAIIGGVAAGAGAGALFLFMHHRHAAYRRPARCRIRKKEQGTIGSR